MSGSPRHGRAHGYDHDVQGLYDSREAAFEGLKAVPGMTVYAGEDGLLHGRPRHDDGHLARWGVARPMKVRGLAAPSPQSPEEAR
jgi:hypothetical protein